MAEDNSENEETGPSTSDPIDLTIDPIDTMLIVINAANPNLPNGEFTRENLEIGSPEELTVEDPETDPNTNLTIRAVPGKGYRGATHVTYNRIDLAEYAKTTLDLEVIETVAFEGDTVEDLLYYLNNTLLLQIQDVHISNLKDDVDIQSGKATLTSDTESLIFHGDLEVDVTGGDQFALGDAVDKDHILDTFPLPVEI